MNNNNDKRPIETWVDRIADLFSGRLHNTVREHRNTINQLQGVIKEMKTANEQAIENAAQAIKEVVGELETGINAFVEKVSILQEQAAQPEAVEPEDISDELQGLQDVVAGLRNVADRLKDSSGSSSGQPTGVGGQEGTGITGGPMQHPPLSEIAATPLAGESGGTDMPTNAEGEAVDPASLSGQPQQPGTIADAPQGQVFQPQDPELSASEIEAQKDDDEDFDDEDEDDDLEDDDDEESDSFVPGGIVPTQTLTDQPPAEETPAPLFPTEPFQGSSESGQSTSETSEVDTGELPVDPNAGGQPEITSEDEKLFKDDNNF